MAIDNCSLGLNILQTIDCYLLWTAAILLGVKYKMTAYKIHSAVVELSVANRDFYREVVIGYAVLYLFSFLVFVFVLTA